MNCETQKVGIDNLLVANEEVLENGIVVKINRIRPKYMIL